jgi:diguanylate cyclase (GGDEF)-like protein
MRILLVEDDEVLMGVLLQALTSQHYIVDTVEDGQLAWEYAESAHYDLLLIDVGLPKLDGISLCQWLRRDGCSTPILLMTARDASSDRIRGLDAGADDYLIKPLDLAELQARVRALLRRGEVSPTPVLEVGELRLDPRSCEVSYGEKLLGLTPKEYSLLELFLRNPARVYSRGQIIEHLWTFDDPPQEDSVKAHIKGLRQKLKAVGAVDWIENVYGIGYRLKEGIAKREDELVTDKEAISSTGKPSATKSAATPNTVKQQFDRAIDSLWEQYQGLMAQRLSELQAAAMAVQSGHLSEELRYNANRAAHKLAGVLGMFGREQGTVLAREIEQTLEDGALLSAGILRLPELVQQLEDLLNLTDAEMPAQTEAARLLLIDGDRNLGRELQELARTQSLDLNWAQVETLESAQIFLQNHSPELVVLNVDGVGQREQSLSLLSDLATRTPPIPVLVLASADGLLNRVTVARLGGQSFLVKPVTAAQVWQVATQLLQRTTALAVKVLVVDDDPMFLAALRPLLEPWGIRMTGLDNPLRFWEVLRSTAPDLLILDVEMPQVNGIELCQAVRIDPHWQGLPILFLTACSDRETIQQVFAAGADDYVTKPIVGPELLTRITNRLERTRLLQTLSTKDPITGLFNQPQSSRGLEQLIQQAERNHHPVCLMVLSLTELQPINRQHGHATGYQVLQRLGHLFQSAFRGSEVLGYWGNGEFVVGMPGLTKVEVGDRLFEFLTTLRQQIFTVPDGNRFQVTCSYALTEYPVDGLTLQSLYQSAQDWSNSH